MLLVINKETVLSSSPNRSLIIVKETSFTIQVNLYIHRPPVTMYWKTFLICALSPLLPGFKGEED